MQLTQAEITRVNETEYRISGAVDFSTVPNLTQRAEEFFKSCAPAATAKRGVTEKTGKREASGEAASKVVTVTTDMSQITECNSAGLALLLEMYRLGRLNNIKLRFVNLPSPLLSIAKAYGIEREIKAICR
jgi:ABC-type transporter Mla MlaB component